MTATEGAEAFEIELEVVPEDLDELGHANNAVYLRWVQEAATAHWNTLATPADRADLVWVVLRHEIDYRLPALPGDTLRARTWVGTAQGLTFERHTEILRGGDRRLLARARTLWVPLDARTRRPRRVTPEVRAIFSSSARRSPPGAELPVREASGQG